MAVIGERGKIGLAVLSTAAVAAVFLVARPDHGSRALPTSSNAIRVVAPYDYHGTWVFDDADAGLRREPFVAGIPAMIDHLTKDIPDAKAGFRLYFSTGAFPGSTHRLAWQRAEKGGNWYRMDDPPLEGWLCPALFRYWKTAPPEIHVRAEAK